MAARRDYERPISLAKRRTGNEDTEQASDSSNGSCIEYCVTCKCFWITSLIIIVVVVLAICLYLWLTAKTPAEVDRLTIVNISDHSVTYNWMKPVSDIDGYEVELKIRRPNAGGAITLYSRSLSAEETEYSFARLEPCSYITLTIKTHTGGVFRRTSKGVTAKEVFIPFREPDPPRDISILMKSASRTLLQWKPPAVAHGALSGYSVRVCQSSGPCIENAEADVCTEFNVSTTRLEIPTTVDTGYCITVEAKELCGNDVLSSQHVTRHFTTPVFAPGPFKVDSYLINSTSVEIVVFAPEEKNGPLDVCTGILWGLDSARTFDCSNHEDGNSTVSLRGLQPATKYNGIVAFANVRMDGQNLASVQQISVKTPKDMGGTSSDSTATSPSSYQAFTIILAVLLIHCLLGRLYA